MAESVGIVTIDARMMVIQGNPYPMVFVPGHQLRGQTCILCDKVIGGQPFHLITLSMMQECKCGQPEIPGITVMRHATCNEPESTILANIIQAKVV
jgi:hypothetical protein